MNRAAALVLGLTLAVGAACPSKAETPVQGYEVVRAYPHDPEAFTQGLIWRDGHLVETTGRQPSVLRRVTLEDGKPVAQIVAPGKGAGLALPAADAPRA